MIRPVLMAIMAGALTFGAGAGAALVGSSGPPQAHPAEVPSGLPQQALEGMSTAQAKHEAATAFVGDMRDWTSCIADEAPMHDESTGEFDPVSACGEKPRPTLPEEGDGGPPEASGFGRATAEKAEPDGQGFGGGIADQNRPDFAGQP